MEKELIIDRETIQGRVRELAGQISSDYAGMEPVLVGILNGVVFFFSDLVMELTIPSKIDFIRAASYGSAISSSGSVRFTKDVEISIQGKPVILVEDIVDTGLTITKVIDRLKEKEPESVKICALINKTERREIEVPITYSGFQVNKGFLIGYGLDYDEQFRYLPGIYVLG
ncbi:MAG: hypoxanthine phosphoribosyltransferase [Deltaproteobacteria bacterium]|nr:hypoxanthine phosphoribosyltransferase [Deltaproteobacteria bacterium]